MRFAGIALSRPIHDHALLAGGIPSKLGVLIHKELELIRFQQPAELLESLFVLKSTTHRLQEFPDATESSSDSIVSIGKGGTLRATSACWLILCSAKNGEDEHFRS